MTDEHAKPALTLVEGVKIIDFVLSNLFNSGVVGVRVLAQYKPRSLIAHLERAWSYRFAASGGSLQVKLPRREAGAGYAGTADAVHRGLDTLDVSSCDLVAILAADHVYRMDLRQMSEFHVQQGADVSVAAMVVPVEVASEFSVLVTDSRARILKFEEKPERPKPLPWDPSHVFASMGNYLFRPPVLVESLRQCAARGGNDFGRHLLPELARRPRTYAYPFSVNRSPRLRPWEERGYWHDVGTHDALSAARKDLSRRLPLIELGDRQ